MPSKDFFFNLVFSILLSTTCVVRAFALDIGERVPAFTLIGMDGKVVKSSSFAGKIVVLEWTNPGCPYVKRHYRDGHMQKMQQVYGEQGVIWLTINSTNPEHSDFLEPEDRQQYVTSHNIKSMYMFDTDGAVGQLFEAKSTPHMFIIDKSGMLAYQGAIDDTPMGDPDKAKNYIDQALGELLDGKPVSEPETKSYGCSIKFN